MKINTLGSKSAVIIFVLSTFFNMVMFANDGSANGPGVPISPYPRHKEEISEDEVVRVKNISRRMHFVRELKIKGTHSYGNWQEVGLMFLKNQNARSEPFFQFKGNTESGDKVTIDFSVVESFSILRVDNRLIKKDRALLEIILFPNISPREILALKPTYSKLRKNYRKRLRLWIALEGEEGKELYLVGRDYDEYELIAKLRDIEKVDFDPGLPGREVLWWAIHAVVMDERYPHRIIMLK